MMTIEYASYLLQHSFVSELYLPIVYLDHPTIHEIIREYNWSVMESMAEGWVKIRKRCVYQD
jgi:hypothetical protein